MTDAAYLVKSGERAKPMGLSGTGERLLKLRLIEDPITPSLVLMFGITVTYFG